MPMLSSGQALHVGHQIDELLDRHGVVVAGHLGCAISAEIPFLFSLVVLDPPSYGGIRVDDRLDEILRGVHRPHPREDRSHISLFGFRCGKVLTEHFMALEAFKVGEDLPPRVMISGRYGKSPPWGDCEARLLLHRLSLLQELRRRSHQPMTVMSTPLGRFITPPVQD